MISGRWSLLTLVTAVCTLLTGCGLVDAPPTAVGPAQWQLTISPQEPAAGIEAEVTLHRLGPDGKRLSFGYVMPVPVVRALELSGSSGREVQAIPRNIDHRGAWLFDLILPETGRWQIAFDPGPLPTTGPLVVDRFAWPTPPAVAPTVVRDAVGDANLSLVVQVVPDRGPILWFLRTHILEAMGVAIILFASVASYLYQQRRSPATLGRS